jgi:hypothetical protein
VLWRAESKHVEVDDFVLASSTGGKNNPSNLIKRGEGSGTRQNRSLPYPRSELRPDGLKLAGDSSGASGRRRYRRASSSGHRPGHVPGSGASILADSP